MKHKKKLKDDIPLHYPALPLRRMSMDEYLEFTTFLSKYLDHEAIRKDETRRPVNVKFQL